MRRLIAIARSPAARWLGLAGSGVALAAFLHVLVGTVSNEDGRRLLSDYWPVLLGALALYCLAYVPMIQAWIILARACGAAARSSDLARVLLVSQIGKYLPGNVAQFVGRALAGQAQGIPFKVAGTAMVLELAGVLTACSILAGAALGTGLVSTDGGDYRQLALLAMVGIAAVSALAGAILVLHRRDVQHSALRPFLIATGCYIVLLIFLAGANILLVGEIVGRWSWTLAGHVAGAFTVSWLVGFVTPGSPAGLGLRELTFFSILAGAYSDETLVLAAAAFRIATVSGDLLAWFAGMLLKPPRRCQPLPA